MTYRDHRPSVSSTIVQASQGVVYQAIGCDISDASDAVEAGRMCGLDFTCEKTPALYTHNGELRKSSNKFVITRKEDGKDLGMCGRVWTPVQSVQVTAVLDGLRDRGVDLEFVHGGRIHDGERCFMLARLRGEIEITRTNGTLDTVCPLVLVLWGNDGSTGIKLIYLTERLFCTNQIAPLTASGMLPMVSLRHTVSAASRILQATQFLAKVHEDFVHFGETAQKLENTPMNSEQFVEFANALILDITDSGAELREKIARKTDALEGRSLTIHENKVTTMLDCFESGIENHGATRWDALNAITEYVDHKKINAQEAVDRIRRYSSAAESGWTGAGAKLKANAFRRLRG